VKAVIALGLTAAVAVGGALTRPGAAVTPVPPRIVHSVAAGASLLPGTQLRSADASYRAVVSNGTLVTYGPHGAVWSTATRGGAAGRLSVQRNGDLALYANGHMTWDSGTVHSGAANRLVLTNRGVLQLASRHGIVWSSAIGNGCRSNRAAKAFRVTIHNQLGRFCAGGQQVLTTPVTTGASALGDGTPLGTWTVYAKAHDTYLRPAAGGVYFVHYWMPYSGPYGMHDSPWQTFAYGSPLYTTRGSHGCTHVPGSTMAWFYGWAPVGTTVRIAA
jgi:hypothetical protein